MQTRTHSQYGWLRYTYGDRTLSLFCDACYNYLVRVKEHKDAANTVWHAWIDDHKLCVKQETPKKLSWWKRTWGKVKKAAGQTWGGIRRFGSWLGKFVNPDDLVKAISIAWAGWYWFMIYGIVISMGGTIWIAIEIATILLLKQLCIIAGIALVSVLMVNAAEWCAEKIAQHFENKTQE